MKQGSSPPSRADGSPPGPARRVRWPALAVCTGMLWLGAAPASADVWHDIGHSVGHTAHVVGHAVGHAAHETGHAIARGAHATGRFFHRLGADLRGKESHGSTAPAPPPASSWH